MRSAPIKLLTHPVDRNLTWYFVASIAFVSVCAIIESAACASFGRNANGAQQPTSVLRAGRLPAERGESREGVLCEDDKRFVSPMDTYWLHDTEFNFHVAHCVLYLEPGLTASLLSQLIVERILDKTNDEGKRIFRRSVPLKC
ncbi:hypothetical protein MRX96_056670 [Rhipicephalus microplus]